MALPIYDEVNMADGENEGRTAKMAEGQKKKEKNTRNIIRVLPIPALMIKKKKKNLFRERISPA